MSTNFEIHGRINKVRSSIYRLHISLCLHGDTYSHGPLCANRVPVAGFPLCTFEDVINLMSKDGIQLNARVLKDILIGHISRDIWKPISMRGKSYIGKNDIKVCRSCLKILLKDIDEYSGSASKKNQKTHVHTKEEIKLGRQVTTKNLKTADIGFVGYAAIRLSNGGGTNMELDDNGKMRDRTEKEWLCGEMDEEFLNFNSDAFYTTAGTLESLLMNITESNSYILRHDADDVNVDSSEELAIQHILDGKLIIVKVQTIPLDIVVKETVVRRTTKFCESK